MAINQPRMFCIECGYPLDGLPEPRCPECGAAFDPADPDSFREDVGALQSLYRAADSTEAHALRDRLTAERIPAAVMGESLQSGHGLPITSPTVWVGKRHLDRARKVLETFLAQRSAGSAAPARKASWSCPVCGERIEGQFEVCWKCQTARPSSGE
jgi:predicted amidophosphoribosyltransferase